ncbi:MAG: dTDP-4-dehydrorhamnose 3,5-epimerase, partial [Oscillospiraceae bacterium]
MGKFKFIETGLEGMFIVEPTVFGDDRGYFMETYNEAEFRENGFNLTFVQDNQSKSRKGVLRGLHMQVNTPQGKLVRVISGEVFDVGVDMRNGSPTIGKWFGAVLSAENKKQFFVPEGFAHGFLVLSETAEFVYKCTRLYDPSDELGIKYDDAVVAVEWPITDMQLLLS